MLNKKLTILGAGNMGLSLATALVKNKVIKPQNLTVTDIDLKKARKKFAHLKIKLSDNNQEAVKNSQVIIIAVKPQNFPILAEEIKHAIKNQLIISIMAGMPLKNISQKLQTHKIIRTMPDLAASVGEAMTTWVASKKVSPKDKKLARTIIQSFGQEQEVESDDDIDRIVTISGCAMGYLYYFAEELAKAGKELKINEKQAENILKQVFLGTAKFWQEKNLDPTTLKNMVTSKKGVTIEAIDSFKKDGMGKIISKGVRKAYKRSKELSK